MRPQSAPASQVRQSSCAWSLAPRFSHIRTRYNEQSVCISVCRNLATCAVCIMLLLHCRPHTQARMHSKSDIMLLLHCRSHMEAKMHPSQASCSWPQTLSDIMLLVHCRLHMEVKMRSLSAKLEAEQWALLTGVGGWQESGVNPAGERDACSMYLMLVQMMQRTSVRPQCTMHTEKFDPI